MCHSCAAHSRVHHFSGIASLEEGQRVAVGKMVFEDFARDIPCDFDGLRDGIALGDKSRQVGAGGDVPAFAERFNFQPEHRLGEGLGCFRFHSW